MNHAHLPVGGQVDRNRAFVVSLTNNRVYAYEKKGEKEQAIADFRKALDINPISKSAKAGLKRLGVTP